MGVYDIQGINCVFQVKIGDEYKTVVCAKSFTFNPVTDMKETTTVGSGFWKEFMPRKLSYTITFNGMLQVNSLSTQEIAKTLLTRQIQFFPFDYQLIYEDNSGNVMIVRGRVYITSSLLDASPVNLVNATHEMQGTGPIEILDELPDLVNITITSTGDSSIAALIQFKLYDSNGDIKFDSGQLDEASGGNLSHPVNVTGQVQSGSYYFFWQATADSIGNEFSTDAPPTKTTSFNDGTSNENTVGVQLYDFTANRNVTFALGIATPPPTCVAPSIPGSPTLHDGQVSVPWATSFVLAGSQPFNITNVTKPSWMTIELYTPTGGSTYVMFNGTPDTAGTGITVSFDINNACGSVSFSDTIDVAAAPVTSSTVDWSFATDGFSVLRIFVNAVLVVDTNSDSANSITVNSGDVVEAQVNGNPITVKELTVTNITDSVTMYSDSGGNQSFTWTAGANKTYAVTGVSNF